MMNGYHGRFLKVDLSTQKTEDMPLSEEDLKDFIGGAGLSAKLIYEHVKNGMDPLAPENPLVFAVGPFTGSTIPMVSRYSVCAISPLTGYWGEATSGGRFPVRLKGSGYDGIFITGKAENPVYLLVRDGHAEIKDASKLWGKDSYETQEFIKNETGDQVSIACIAKAGENRLLYSCIMNDKGRAAGRSGMGAVMGSKNLKAVVVGGNAKTTAADPDRLKELTLEAQTVIRSDMTAKGLTEYGTNMWMDMGMIMADVPAKYFTKSVFPASRLTSTAFRDAYAMGRYACTGCLIGCGREVKNFGPDKKSVDGPEYETVAAFGPLCWNFDLDSIIEANHLCNVHGLDTLSTGVSIAYAMYLAEKGVLTPEKAGLEIKWGDHETIIQLVKMIVNQEGIGKLLGLGTLRMARELGRDEGEAAQVKGLEMPMHDARSFHGQAISYATGSRGACHQRGNYYEIDIAGMILEYGVMATNRFSAEEQKAVMAAKVQALKDTFDSLTMCKFASVSPTFLAQALSAVTGREYTPETLLEAGERSINIKRGISLKLGLTQAEDRLPEICATPLKEGSSADKVPDMKRLLKDYYEFRQWNPETGKPEKEKLEALGLHQVARDLYGN
ncbi:MAG: aldehyde ferredoxin oxidoreductase family protein [Proteobacteria bacterium]|nr:aldehyde ferredoxin oxidoreductase family protein [Pseudomonadota bacterium]MBU4470809.1 aldehyde ferredoxin oxidoreductase family protein [Pseudomonadota bacterium]MCG2751463.1 aldehyde ferredoxin oxidoreductase family protein [Desulfobacteraceae bacterium]